MLRKLIIILWLLLLNSNAFAINQVNKIRIGESNNKTRIVLESSLSGTLSAKKVFQLTNPPRLVIDMPTTDFKTNTDDISINPKSLIKDFRQGIFNPKTHRIVVDLKGGVKYKYFKIGKKEQIGERLVIDLTPSKNVKYVTPKAVKQQKPMKTITVSTKNIQKKAKTNFVVMIDPGHGGVDPGAVAKQGFRRIYEKNITLKLAKKLQSELNKYSNITAHLTRTNDIFVPLRTRIKRATKKSADLFISIHADSHNNKKVRGGSVYILSENSSDKEAARLARVANRGDEVAGVILKNEARDIQSILIDLTQRESMNKSALLAQDVLKFMKNVVLVKHSKANFAGFVVLKSADIPSILVEASYLSNSTDRNILTTSSKQTKLAKAIAKGVRVYLNKNY
ncbi:MAG: AMIN domain-containing protein [Proteobacteria bacterium]|nr:AMIN domain-containing protein [Pseudomonadota bacterium]